MSSTQNHILMEIPPRLVSVGGPQVHRLIPYSKKRMVGPFIFFDYFPATDFAAGDGLNVRPHPHIGLSTLSYLLEGQVLHHDSLGNKQILRPGDVNWMTAGSGISHSERLPEEIHGKAHRLHLLQFWVALPLTAEDRAPSFTHHEMASIPSFKVGTADVSLIAGEAFKHKSPVDVYSSLFFMDVKLPKTETFTFDPGNQELAFYIIKGKLDIDGKEIPPDDFVVLEQGSSLKVTAAEDTQFIVLGGEPFPEPRYIYWNYVSSSREKIEEAKKQWRELTFPQVPGETDIIPLPPEPAGS
ncbi:pirin family protein [Bdellovibrio bacteriovorus]|uniref:pirin family protein n=1 Tax=Bdellovibrio bacteriovorus TaxID=959 RepID=UPI0021CE1CE6|nr:pirin family protein [Bdellovibrio bacteriovorus]UXR65056.1 pirin family protein [Bdellovibrio bacteriovorus]